MIVRKFRNNVLVGLLLITPIVLTAVVVRWLFTLFTDLFLGFFPKRYWHESDYEIVFRVAAFAAVLVLLFLIGFFVRNVLGKRLYHFGDTLLARIPVVNKIYVWVRQVIEVLLAQRQTLFKEVVLLEYPRPGVYSLGFVTAVVPKDVSDLARDSAGAGEYLSVFIPTTPNPTSGWFCVIPRAQTISVNMSTGDAMKLIISGGAVYPGHEASLGKPATLLDKLDQWITEENANGRKP